MSDNKQVEVKIKSATLHQAISIMGFFDTTASLHDKKLAKGVKMTYDGVNLYFIKGKEVAGVPAASVASFIYE